MKGGEICIYYIYSQDYSIDVQINLNGRVSLNFKDLEAVRALTCTLLREDFGFSTDIPPERLISTVPLRLNYIHWVEDLIGHQNCDKSTLRRGIDIGTWLKILPWLSVKFHKFCEVFATSLKTPGYLLCKRTGYRYHCSLWVHLGFSAVSLSEKGLSTPNGTRG